MDDSLVNRILYLAKLKMELPSDSKPDNFSICVTIGDRQCILTYEELHTKTLNLQQSLNKTNDFDSNGCTEFHNSNQEQPMDLSIKKEVYSSAEAQPSEQTSLDQVKSDKCEYEDATNDSSIQSEVPDTTANEQIPSEHYFASAESNNESSYSREQASAEPSSSLEPGEIIEITPKINQISSSVIENVDDLAQADEKKVEHTSSAELGNRNCRLSHSAQNYNSSNMKKMWCYRCGDAVYHRAWNCPQKRNGRDRNTSTQWTSSYTFPKWRPQFIPYGKFERNNPFYNTRTNFGQKKNKPAKMGTFRSVIETLQKSNLGEPKSQAPRTNKKSKKVKAPQIDSHKIFFQGEWFTNRIAADAESYLNKKEEISRQIKKEHRELDEGFEDIQLVFSEDECQNENPVFVYNNLKKNFKDEDDNGGPSASSTAA